MKIIITTPNDFANDALGLNLQKRILRRWTTLFPDNLHTYNPLTCEIHGEMLTRIWQDILNSDDPEVLISESDFIPYDTLPEEITRLRGQGLVISPFVTRNNDLELTVHHGESGAWFIFLNRSVCDPDLPLDWLSAGGIHNDAANMALRHYAAVVDFDLIELLHPYDSAPEALGIEYDGLGYHAFFTRHWNDDPERELLPGYTLRRHLEDINARLEALGS